MNHFTNLPPTGGSLLVVSAPSGAGKSSLIKALRTTMPDVGVSVSHTTRAMRPGEVDGEHYHFVDVHAFRSIANNNAFVEHAEVFGNLYGTAKSSLEGPLRAGRDLILEIDWQGARQVRDAYPEALSVFILPPSIETLRHRLESRGQDRPETIDRRMSQARSELSHWAEFDYLIINDDFDKALQELGCLVATARLRRAIQSPRCISIIELDG
ncbi:MAG: guanylate kinase [Gammaproteobacteria bacterium]|nr:guanylate kinase [Gammaproteobacteria bacterium]MBU1653661.1 guanylate kinase [Gammaproteobacteria bacterium]MBU1962491.1 guanylate kinase [Gammaproteobacteria bacterium]